MTIGSFFQGFLGGSGVGVAVAVGDRVGLFVADGEGVGVLVSGDDGASVGEIEAVGGLDSGTCPDEQPATRSRAVTIRILQVIAARLPYHFHSDTAIGLNPGGLGRFPHIPPSSQTVASGYVALRTDDVCPPGE